jgi:antirestriction protein ArdC
VFNIDQVEGIRFNTENAEVVSNNNPLEACEEIINNMPLKPEIKTEVTEACYVPLFDLVQMPHLKFFISSECYYSTLFHELIHSTGHSSRLNRFKAGEKPAKFGDAEYSKEELTAELGAAYLCNVAGIENEATKNNHVGYLKSWIAALKNDKTMIIYAAQKAYKAAAFILNDKQDEEQEEQELRKQAS